MKATKKDFAMSYADLCLLASNMVVFMTRDATQFATRGVDAAAITAFHDLGDAFEVFPMDEYFVGQIKIATDAKNASRETCTALVQLISGFFEQEFGLESGQYSELRVKGLSVSSEGNFLLSCRAVVSVATEYLTTLSAIGLTQQNIDDLDTAAQTFEDNLNTVASKKALRDTKAKERTVAGNELFSFCSKYSKIGKLIWENVDESKYNDYIIYPTVHSGLSKPQNLAATYNPLNPPNITLSWDAVAEATSYDVYVSIKNIGSPAGDFSFLDNFAGSPAAIPSIIDKRNYFKIKAKAEGKTSDYSDEVFVDVPVL